MDKLIELQEAFRVELRKRKLQYRLDSVEYDAILNAFLATMRQKIAKIEADYLIDRSMLERYPEQENMIISDYTKRVEAELRHNITERHIETEIENHPLHMTIRKKVYIIT